MKTLTFKSNLIIAFALVLFLAGCKGDQGDPGPAGKNGTNGTNGMNGKDGVDGDDGTNGKDGTNGTNGTNGKDGTNGTNGKDGTNGAGFDEAAKYGDIFVNLAGTRPDGKPFTKFIDFKFAPTDIYWSRAYQRSASETETQLRRYMSFSDRDWEDEESFGYIDANLRVNTTTSPVSYLLDMHIKAPITTTDFMYFNMDSYFYNTDNTNLINPSFTNYSYTPSTGRVRYSFSFTIDANNNSTGYELKVAGSVNAIVFQSIGGRSGGRVAHPSPVRAVMLPLEH